MFFLQIIVPDNFSANCRSGQLFCKLWHFMCFFYWTIFCKFCKFWFGKLFLQIIQISVCDSLFANFANCCCVLDILFLRVVKLVVLDILFTNSYKLLFQSIFFVQKSSWFEWLSRLVDQSGQGSGGGQSGQGIEKNWHVTSVTDGHAYKWKLGTVLFLGRIRNRKYLTLIGSFWTPGEEGGGLFFRYFSLSKETIWQFFSSLLSSQSWKSF